MKTRKIKSDILHQSDRTPVNTGVLFLPYQNRIFIRMDYKAAKIYYGAPRNQPITVKNDWYVYAYAINEKTGKWQRFIRKGGINRAHTISERKRLANDLVKAINQLLAEGWNPFVEVQSFTEQGRPFSEMIEFALELSKKKLAPKSYLGYKSQVKFILEAAQRVSVADMPISKVTRKHIHYIFNDLLQTRKISNKRYNKYLVCLKSMYTTLMDYDVELIENDPVHGMKSLPVEEVQGYASLEPVREKIKELSYKDSFMFGVICQTLYATGIRPNELTSLRWQSLDRTHLLLLVDAVNSKNRKARMVPVKQSLIDLYDYLLTINPTSQPNDHIFSDNETLLSGSKRLHPNRLAERWTRVMHKEGGLDKKYKMYALKYLGADDKIMAGIDIEHLKDLYGHHSTGMTRIYARKMKQKGGEIIREQSPDF